MMSPQFDSDAFIHVVVEALASALQSKMDAEGVNNYAAFSMQNAVGNHYLAMFTRLPDGKTPMQMQADAESECERLRTLFRAVLIATDSEMMDGDFARQCAERALYPNEPEKWLYGKDPQ